MCRRMHSGKVDERGGRDQGVMFSCCDRHQSDNECNGDGASTGGKWEQGMAMAPVEKVPLAQCGEMVRVDGSACVEEAVDHIDGPRAAGKEERDPWFKTNAGRAGDRESPDDRHRGCIETGEMPQLENAAELPVRLRMGYGLTVRVYL